MSKFSYKIVRDWENASVKLPSSLGEAVGKLNEGGLKICLVVNDDKQIVGTISDGDVRRALLKGASLTSNVVDYLESKPITVSSNISAREVEKIMLTNKVFQIPEIDDQNRVQSLYIWDGIAPREKRSTPFVIMAGGEGVRLRPHTENCPKPMLPINGKPMLQNMIEKARDEGIVNFIIAIKYLGHVIEDYFGDGKSFGVNISYLRETTPLGTVGALSLLNEPPSEPTIVANGDLISQINFCDILDFHNSQSSAATMAVKVYEMQNPFGVVKLDDLRIIGFEEKPVSKSYINAGIYVLSATAFEHLEAEERCDMPTLFERLASAGLKTLAYPLHENWLDVGRPSDLAVAKRLNENPQDIS